MHIDYTDEYQLAADSSGNEDNSAGGDEYSEMSMEDLMAMYEQTFEGFQSGEIVEGRVVDIDNERVMIDIGYKAEGEVPKSEFLDEDGRFNLQVGDRVNVLLVRKDEDGYPLLSRRNVETVRRLNDLAGRYETGATVSGRIVSQKKGGFIVDVGITAFLPASQLDVKRVSDFSEWLDTEHEFKIIQFDKKNENIVLSRRALMEEQQQRARQEALSRLQVGEVVEGTINNITDYGLFVDLDGVVGLVHVSNLSWTQMKHPSKYYDIGDRIQVKILEIDEKSQKVTLGVKQLMENPWETLHERFPVGSVIEGQVRKVTDFGIFLAIEEGINGLVHISDLSWNQEVKKPSRHYKKGDVVQARILDIDKANQRVRLGVKQLQPHPWEELARTYPPGTPVSGKVINVANFGVFVEIEEGVQGLVHVSEIPAEKGANPLEGFEMGQTVEARVLEVQPEEKKIRLTLKPEPKDKSALGEALQEKIREQGEGKKTG